MVVLSFFGEAKLTLVPVVAKNRSSQSDLLFLKSWRRWFIGNVASGDFNQCDLLHI